MGKVSLATETVQPDIDVEVIYDPTSGLPTAATGQKELVEGTGQTAEEPINTLTILPATSQKYADAVAAAQKTCATAIAAAQTQLEADLVADNYPGGIFTVPAASIDLESASVSQS